MTETSTALPPRIAGADLMHKWYALLSAPVFFMLGGALSFGGQPWLSTVFAMLAMAMPVVFVILAVRDGLRARRAYRAWLAARADQTPPAA